MDRKLIFTMNSNEDAIIFVCMGGQGVKSPLPPIIIICAIHLTNKPNITYICMDTYVYYINIPIKYEVTMLNYLGFICIKPIPP